MNSDPRPVRGVSVRLVEVTLREAGEQTGAIINPPALVLEAPRSGRAYQVSLEPAPVSP